MTNTTQQIKDANGNIIYMGGTGSGANTSTPFQATNNAIPFDGTNSITLATAGADANNNTVNMLPCLSYLLGFNGTTWDRLQVDGGKNLKVSLAVSLPTGSNVIGGIFGDLPSGSIDSGNPIKTGGVAHTANPTAVSDGQRVNRMHDKVGRTVVVHNQVRDLVAIQQTTITSSTSETTIVTAAGSNMFADLVQLTVTNSSSTSTLLTLKDSTGGTVRGNYSLAANGNLILPFGTPLPQATANNNWTLTCGTSVASIYIVAQFVKNV